MRNKVINLGIVGVGKIVRDQHLPSIAKNPEFNLVATASRNASVDGVQSFVDIESMLDLSDIDAVALCMPPQYRQPAAKLALDRGKHVLLEKPPGATVSEVDHLAEIAEKNKVSLYTTWHSRHGAAMNKARILLAQRRLISVSITWNEDVRKWHPGQEWIWQAGGLGVFDPGINALSILTELLASPAYVSRANLLFPANKAAPIAADLAFANGDDVNISAQFDWRVRGADAWNIEFQTDRDLLQVKDGGARLFLDDQEVKLPKHSLHSEYEAIYARFLKIIRSGISDVDLAPLKLVADAFLLASREEVSAFKQ